MILVTGSGRGIGSRIAIEAARQGADVVVNDIRIDYNNSEQGALKVCREVEALGRKAIAVEADVSREEDVAAMVARADETFGGMDVVINNAGINIDSRIRNMTIEAWKQVLDVHLTGTFLVMKHAIPLLYQRERGAIVNISSVVGQMGVPGAGNYAAAKAGIIGLTKTTARELANKNITVNAVALGYINEGLLFGLPEEMRTRILSQIPLGRFGDPDQIARNILYFASSEAEYITGQVININGGFYM